MPVRKLKPTSAGQRFTVRVVTKALHKGKPHAPLLAPLSKQGGRNNAGRITVRHRGGGHKRHYRLVDFRRNKDGVPGRVERLEYDPNRSANLALVLYADGERRYILAPKRVAARRRRAGGQRCADQAPATPLPLKNIPVGTWQGPLRGDETRQGRFRWRAAPSASVKIVAREGNYATLRLRSARCARST